MEKQTSAGQTVLITGAAGFIGHKVSEVLLNEGHRVVGIDNINDYYDSRLKRWRLEKISDNNNFSLFENDILDFNFLEELYSSHKFNAVINLAAMAGVRVSVEDPWKYLDTNVKGVLNLLECCKKFNVKKFVQASTSSIYGLNKMPFHEEMNTDLPLAPYSATKKGAEALCYSYHFLCGTDFSLPRFFTVYGPSGRPDMSIFKFIKNIDLERAIPVFGDGKQTRDFTYIDDIARGTVKCLNPCGYEFFNLGNDNAVELLYVINMIEDHLKKKAKIDWLPLHPADIKAAWASIEKAKKLLDWVPEVTIEEGVKRTVEWYKENREFIVSLKDN